MAESPKIEINENLKNGNHHHQQQENGEENDQTVDNHQQPEPQFKPKVELPIVEVKTLEDDEEVIVEQRARIYRYDDKEEEPEFKERGTGIVKILRHKQTHLYRILMRRDKTLKICANHYITGSMKLDSHNNSDKVFLYSTLADFYENQINAETFAIKFSNAKNATIFKNGFEEAVKNALIDKNNNKDEDNDKEEEKEEEEKISKNSIESIKEEICKPEQQKIKEDEELVSKIQNIQLETIKTTEESEKPESSE